MFNLKKHFKKIGIVAAILATLGIFMMPPLKAQSADDGGILALLAAIKADTGEILKTVDLIPLLIKNFADQWTTAEGSDSMPNMIENFGKQI